MHRILIADDRELMRTALKAILAMRPTLQVCGEASEFGEVIAKTAALNPDLIILDLKMPPFNGLQVARAIGATSPLIPIIMYTLYKTHQLEEAAKLVGIRRVVGKEDGVQNLLGAIDAELATKN